VYGLSNFTNYQSVIRINDIVEYNHIIWAASSGGLVSINAQTKDQQLNTTISSFPDLNLTALCFDSKGNLWVGSASGYLSKVTSTGAVTVYNSYYGSGWGILDIHTWDNYVIVGSNNGSAFSIQRKA